MGRKGRAVRKAKSMKRVKQEESKYPLAEIYILGESESKVIVSFSKKALISMKNGQSVPVEMVDGERKRIFTFMSADSLAEMKSRFAVKLEEEKAAKAAQAEISGSEELANEIIEDLPLAEAIESNLDEDQADPVEEKTAVPLTEDDAVTPDPAEETASDEDASSE